MSIFELTLTISGPVMARGGEALSHGVDTPFLRDDRGNYILPGTQLKGVLRHTLEAMREAGAKSLADDALQTWFGASSASLDEGSAFVSAESAWMPRASMVFFGDLVADTPAGEAGLLTRVAVDDATGSVVPGALQVLEAPGAVGQDMVFSGRVTIDAEPGMVQVIVKWLDMALKMLPAIGAHKSAGFGRIQGFRLKAEPSPQEPVSPTLHVDLDAAVASGGVAYEVTFAEPFLVSSDRWTGNAFRGDSQVSGAVMKAVLAKATGADDPDHPLHDVLDRAVVLEARPAKADAPRPRAVPLSWYLVLDGGDEPLVLDALDEEPEQWADSGLIAFSPEWKESDTVNRIHAACGRTFEPEWHVRTRTAVNARGSAKKGHLFSLAAVQPGEHIWKGEIRKGALTGEEFQSLLQALPGRLTGIGKTNATAVLKLAAPASPMVTNKPKSLRLVLETPAVLFAADALETMDRTLSPSEALRCLYEAYFADALQQASGGPKTVRPKDLKLRFYATQKRLGGYLSGRFPPRDDGYAPWVLTERGSVFDFVVPDGFEDAALRLLSDGLPVPTGLSGVRRTWRGNPFLPTNGFGEVSLAKPDLIA